MDPAGASTRILQVNYVHNVATDVLAPYVPGAPFTNMD